jgi:hypothetical protein
MARYGSGFREPPWVMGSPKEVMEWLDATHPPKKEHYAEEPEETKYLTDLHIKFDFDVKKTVKKSSNPLFRTFGLFTRIEEDFDPFSTTELILRGLAKAKFHNTTKITVDKKTLYEHPENKKDLRKTIELIYEFKKEIYQGSHIEIDAQLEDVKTCLVTIQVKKVHRKKEHTIDLQFKGKIRADVYHTFLNYLKGHIEFTDEKQP